MKREPWEGHFIGIEERKFQFGFLTNGEAELNPVDSRGNKISKTNPIEIEFKILETAPDGTVVSKQIKEESLTSTTEATKNPSDPVTITGKTTGDASFQITITPGSKTISLTGAVTDPGTLKNPLTFVISAKFTPYNYQSSTDEDSLKAFEKKIKREDLNLELLSGETKSIPFTERLDLGEEFPEGFKHIQLETHAYGETEFSLQATGTSKIVSDGDRRDYLWNSFTLHWVPDPNATPESQQFIITGG
ncbi:MAG: hypothetical protein ABJQ29_17095 [Luteolibacter sp.]